MNDFIYFEESWNDPNELTPLPKPHEHSEDIKKD